MSDFNTNPSAEYNIRAVVFDLDGLMLNTEDVFDLAGQQLLERRGMVMTTQVRDAMLGRRAHEAFAVMKEMTGVKDDIHALMMETKELFAAIAENRLAMMPGLPELLDLIESRNLPRAVATSSPRSYMTELLTRFNLLDRFHFTMTAEDVTHGKPHPEIYLAVAERLNVAPSEMLVLEDSETGTRAASAAGAIIVSVPNRHTAAGDFSMATLRVESLQDARLLSLLNGEK
ncbi:MAG: HAD family phosphatase [Planctomycetaceae bacterium]